MGGAALAQDELTLGGSVQVNVPGVGVENAISLQFTLEQPAVVSIAVRTQDATNPVFQLLDPYGRDTVAVDDNPSSPNALDAKDAAIDNTMLLDGTYTLNIARMDGEGSGDLEVFLLEGASDVYGIGQIQKVTSELGPTERFNLPITLNTGDVISLGAVGITPELDLRIALRGPDGIIVARDDDNSTFDFFLGDFDPRIHQHIVQEAGEYTIIVRAFSGNQVGEFLLVIQRHGQIEGGLVTETLTGVTENRARNPFSVDFIAGQIVTITATAAEGSSVDPQIQLLDPDGIYIALNDDHSTDDESIGRFDARVSEVRIEKSGTYELDIDSISGRGAFAVEIVKLGTFIPANYEPVDSSAAFFSTPEPTPEPQPTIVPEVTAEPTASN
jgi:predicted  nucleic acid-binding Zn-ribbon protein